MAKTRDYGVERVRRNMTQKRFEVSLPIEAAEEFKEQLKNDGTDFSTWVRSQIAAYMERTEVK